MTVACSDCGAMQRIPVLTGGEVATCRRCDRVLDRSEAFTLAVGLAWSAAMLFLLIPSYLLPVMSASMGDRTLYAYLASGVKAVWVDGWPFLGLMLGLFIIVLPLIRSTLLTVVLGALRLGRRPRWLGRAFRYAQTIHLWAMPEVLIIAGFVIHMRASRRLVTHVEVAGWCLVAAGILSLLLHRVLAPHSVWQAIMPDRERPAAGPTLSCTACDLVLPLDSEGEPCPRCGHTLRLRKLNSLTRTTALVVAGYLMYFPAYYFPMSYTVQPNGVKERTIIDGVRELFKAGFWYLGVIVITASILIPMLKLVGLTWMLVRVRWPSKRHLWLRTRLHRTIHRIGRWSYTDPLIVALTIPLMSFPGVVQVHNDIAALPFALVVALTMLAARTFDPRLMWDAAEGRL